MLNMNEYVAGETIITLGNNAPGIFGSVLGLTNKSRHAYSDTMSVSLFMGVFTSSIIMWVKPFAIDAVYFVRCVGFVVLYVTFVDFSVFLTKGFLTIGWAVSMTLIFPIYLTLILCDQYMQNRKDRGEPFAKRLPM